ncbi:tyrosine-type recombinase/integrase [Mycobacterium avium]|nr:tyrosine-type recombinase/integrase [Mycobacterium avium]
MSISEPLLEEWQLWQYAARKADSTILERVRVIALFALETGCSPVTAKAGDIIRWLGSHTEWSQSTAATYHSYLRSWFTWLTIMDHRADNPMVKLGAPRYPYRVPRPVSDDDLVRLLLTPMHHRTRVMILLAALAGLRVHEIAKLRGEDIDLSKPALHVEGKGKRTAWIPLHPLLVEAALTMPAKGFWFPANSRRPGNHVHSKSVSDIIGNAMRRAGARGTPHSLRHWYGTTLLDDGADLRTVQELLRHRSLATTQIYTKVNDERRSEAVVRLNPFRGAAWTTRAYNREGLRSRFMKAHAVVVAAATPMFCLAFLFAPAAWASPPTPQQVCDALDADPEPSTFISLLLEAAQDEGISTTAAGAQMGAYVGDRCPRHLPMLERYLADRQEASQR